MNFGVANDAAFADVPAAGFELRLDQNYSFRERRRRGKDRNQQQRCRDKETSMTSSVSTG